MISPNSFIVSPKENKQYINTKKIGDVEIVINTSIEEAKDVQRVGVVLEVPKLHATDAKIGDEVIVHHNVFRISYNDSGVALESSNYIKDNMFYVDPDLVYMIIRDGKKMSVNDNVFVEPIKEVTKLYGEIEKEHVGVLRYGNQTLAEQGINEGDKVVFKQGSEYEFVIDGERMYMMKTKRILAKL